MIDTRIFDFQDLGLWTRNFHSNEMWPKKSISVDNYYNTTYINNAVPEGSSPSSGNFMVGKEPWS
jgi:hypothetical protein